MSESTHPDFGQVLVEAAMVLRLLPRSYTHIGEAQHHIQTWRGRHANLRAELLVDHPPGSLHVEYDLLLDHPDGGTLALTWREDRGLPWAVCYADHWAANGLVTVNGHTITVQQALVRLRMLGHIHPDILTDLVHQHLLTEAVEQAPPPVSRSELQGMADQFRQIMGLHTAADTFRWLEDVGIPQSRWEAMLTATVQSYKMKHQITAAHLEAYFEAHRDAYEYMRLFVVQVPRADLAFQLVAYARQTGLFLATETLLQDAALPRLSGTLMMQYVGTLPPVVRAAAPGEIVGPHHEGHHYLVAQVYSRQAARLDEETREAVREAVYQEWLMQQRAVATVQWHWM